VLHRRLAIAMAGPLANRHGCCDAGECDRPTEEQPILQSNGMEIPAVGHGQERAVVIQRVPVGDRIVLGLSL